MSLLCMMMLTWSYSTVITCTLTTAMVALVWLIIRCFFCICLVLVNDLLLRCVQFFFLIYKVYWQIKEYSLICLPSQNSENTIGKKIGTQNNFSISVSTKILKKMKRYWIETNFKNRPQKSWKMICERLCKCWSKHYFFLFKNDFTFNFCISAMFTPDFNPLIIIGGLNFVESPNTFFEDFVT